MNDDIFLVTIYTDYLPFVDCATNDELAEFIRAQIKTSLGEQITSLTGMAKALYESHCYISTRIKELNGDE